MGGLNSGDRLARGGVKAQFMTSEGGIPADKWAQAFDDFNPEEFKNAPNKSSIRTEIEDSSGDASLSSTGDVSTGVGEVGAEPITR
jgi:hypothetical protein